MASSQDKTLASKPVCLRSSPPTLFCSVMSFLLGQWVLGASRLLPHGFQVRVSFLDSGFQERVSFYHMGSRCESPSWTVGSRCESPSTTWVLGASPLLPHGFYVWVFYLMGSRCGSSTSWVLGVGLLPHGFQVWVFYHVGSRCESPSTMWVLVAIPLYHVGSRCKSPSTMWVLGASPLLPCGFQVRVPFYHEGSCHSTCFTFGDWLDVCFRYEKDIMLN